MRTVATAVRIFIATISYAIWKIYNHISYGLSRKKKSVVDFPSLFSKIYLNNEKTEYGNGRDIYWHESYDRPKLFTYVESPLYQQYNKYIRSGYRGQLCTQLCAKSVFWWTNETINIWSHLFGFLLFLWLSIYDLFVLDAQISAVDRTLFLGVLLCFQVCMLFSVLYHTFSCRSEADCDRFLAYDLLGVALSFCAIYISGIFYAFRYETELRNFYIGTVLCLFLIAMILQIQALGVTMLVKQVTFVLWACYGLVPTVHWVVRTGGLDHPLVALLLPRIAQLYAINLVALVIYATKIPERFAAGKFDFIGHSHQWWHLIILFGLYHWHETGLIYAHYRHAQQFS